MRTIALALTLGALTALCQPEADPPTGRPAATAAIAATLDALHQAAADADGERYFALFTPDAVFLGTDATERWTLDQFKAWAAQRNLLEGQRGWTYTTTERSITLAPCADVAWFDERLANDSLGECRGTGALVRSEAGWKIAQYNLTVPVPNALMGEVARMIRQAEQKPDGR
jgi:hypothetical protein